MSTVLIISPEFWDSAAGKPGYAGGVSINPLPLPTPPSEETQACFVDEEGVLTCSVLPVPIPGGAKFLHAEAWNVVMYGELDQQHNCIIVGEQAFQLVLDRFQEIGINPIPLP